MSAARTKKKVSKTRSKAKESPAERKIVLNVRSVSEMYHHRSWVFFGRSGTGKTTLAGSFPQPMLFLNVKDKGTDSICDLGDGVKVMDVESWEDFELAYWYLIQNPDEYKTIVIDTITQLQQLGIIKVMEDADKDPSQAGQWGGMTKQMWGQVVPLMKMWITNLRDLPMEVVFLAQDRTSDTETDDPEVQLDPEVGPRLTPSVAAHINAEVSVVGNLFIRRKTTIKKVSGKKKEVSRTQYCMRLGPHPVYVTKARKPKAIKLPGVVVDPTYESLVKILKGEQ